jgi:uncharacterized membrane protein YhaH (DUF805 family)
MQNLSPIGWALRPLRNYANFAGRASRAEFWWYTLAMTVFYIAMWIVLFGTIASLSVQKPTSVGAFGVIGVGAMLVGLLWLGLIIPTIAVQVRRLHDTNRSGWWLGAFWLLYLVYIGVIISSIGTAMSVAMAGGTPPSRNGSLFAGSAVLGLLMFVYSIVLLVFFCLQGTRGANRFGEDPYGPDVEQVFA